MIPALALWLHVAARSLEHGAAVTAKHSGVPVVVVAGFSLVIAFRLARRAVHLVVEVALATALVLIATRAGWLRF